MITRLVWLEDAVRATKRALLIGLAVVAALVAGIALARAQSGGALTYGAFFLTARAPDVVATTTSQRIALGASVTVARVCNLGPDNAYVALGGTTITASASGSTLVIPGQCINMAAASTTNMAAVATSDLGTLLQTMLGSGNP